MEPYEITITLLGAAALGAAWLPIWLDRRALSLPILLVAVGVVASVLPIGLPRLDPRDEVELVERVTEFLVIVSLMGVGLEIDRPVSWRGWSGTVRMLAFAMPVTILMTTGLGVAVGGLGFASALLLGAALAPTDPVLATDVQVGEPDLEATPTARTEEEVRFVLTSEGGLNDALAFPFVYAALIVADASGEPTWTDAAVWFGWDVIGRVGLGLLGGWLVGRLMATIAFGPPGPLRALADAPQAFVAVAASLLAFGVTEAVHGYGFLAVFVAALTFRHAERHHEFHLELHQFVGQLERLGTVGLLVLLGAATTSGVLADLSWRHITIGVLMVIVVRPVAGWVALLGSGMTSRERRGVSFFGIRGFGSVYYLAYALSARSFDRSDDLWALVTVTILVSVAVHGVVATPWFRTHDRLLRARGSRAVGSVARRRGLTDALSGQPGVAHVRRKDIHE